MDYDEILDIAKRADAGEITLMEAILLMVRANAPTFLIREVFGL